MPPRTADVTAEREGEGWHFQIRDTGIGIEKQYAERIFLIFQRQFAAGAESRTGNKE